MATQDKTVIFTRLRKIKKILAGFFLVVAFLIAVLSSIVATEAGSRWATESVARILKVDIKDIHGNLLTGLDIGSLDYQKNTLNVHLEKMAFRWQPLTLFYARVSISPLSIDRIFIRLPDKSTSPVKYVWPSFSQPIYVQLIDAQIRSLQIEKEGKRNDFSDIRGSLALGSFHLTIKNLEAINSQVQFNARGSVSVHYPYKLNLTGNWKSISTSPDTVPLNGDAKVLGDIRSLKITHALNKPLLLKTEAVIEPAFHDNTKMPQAKIINDWTEQTITPQLIQRLDNEGKLQFLHAFLSSHGQLQIEGWLDKYRIISNIHTKTPTLELIADIDASGLNTGADSSRKSSPIQASLHLDKLKISAQPLSSTVTLAKNTLVSSLALANNYLLITGDINLFPSLQWNLIAQGEHLNSEMLIDGWPSDLRLYLESRGEFIVANTQLPVKADAKKWRLDIEKLKIAGAIRKLDALVQGEIHFDGERWRSSNITAAVGDNQLSLKGQAGNDVAMEWKLNAPSVHQIYPEFSGSIISNGIFSGSLKQPRIQINAQANQLVMGKYAVNTLSIKLKPQGYIQPNLIEKANNNYDLAVDATQLQLQSQYFEHVNISGFGNIDQQNISGQLQHGEYGNMSFKLSGRWQYNLWQAQWHELTLNFKKIPAWTLASSTPTQIDKIHADIGRVCLTSANDLSSAVESTSASAHPVQEAPGICLDGKWISASNLSANPGFSLNIDAHAFPISQLRAWFKPEVTLAGVIDGKLNLGIDAIKPMTLTANIKTRDAKLLYQFQGGNVEVYPLEQCDANISLKEKQWQSSMAMNWGKYGVINATAKYNLNDKKIQGNAAANLPNLAPLEGVLPFLNNVQGSASAVVNLAGTIDKPEVTGNLSLAQGNANLPKLGLELKNMSLQIASTLANSAHVEGNVTSGDGTLVVQGDFANIGADDWNFKTNIFGANIRIIQQTQLAANISPNLHLSANSQAINLTGSTEIPWARANIKSLPASATRISNDAVIVEDNNSQIAIPISKKRIPFYTDIILFFGDDVRFKGFGLDTRLTGKVNVLKEESRQIFTTGFVAVDKGVYKAYGQELSIERGRLIFQGPYDNPGLDIRAVRVIDDQSAGLDIGGTLQRPKSTVFAIPARTDSEAMAMLLTGKPLSQSSREDAYSIIGAISKLGMSQGDSMTTDIAHKFGLDEVTVKADKGLDQSALWIGKYITPKLFVHYVVGLFDQAFSLGMTYKLNEKLQLEAESGKTQSIDIIYKIER